MLNPHDCTLTLFALRVLILRSSGRYIALKGQADFIFDETEKYRMEPGIVLLGGLRKHLEIRTGSEGFEYCLVHYLPMDVDPVGARRLTDVSMIHAAMDPDLKQLLDRLLQAASSPDSMGLLEKKSLFYQLLNQVLQADRHERNKTWASARSIT